MSPIAVPMMRPSVAFVVENRLDIFIGGVVEPHSILDGICPVDDLVIAVEHVIEADFASIDRIFDG